MSDVSAVCCLSLRRAVCGANQRESSRLVIITTPNNNNNRKLGER
jgi:hypothetical protein